MPGAAHVREQQLPGLHRQYTMLRLAASLTTFACLAATAASLTTSSPLNRASLHRGGHARSSRGQRSMIAAPLAPLHALAVGWEAQVDEASGQTYYMNSQTGESQWEVPQ